MKLWRWVTRWWKVLRAVAALVTVVGDATEDTTLTPDEQSRIWKALWVVINTAKGKL